MAVTLPSGAAIRGVRAIALLEAAKGMLVLLAGFGLLTVVHRDLQSLAEDFVRHSHLNPASKYPRIFLDAAERYSDLHLWVLAAMAFGYAALRLIEAYGLWLARRWAEWLAVASGGIYVPLEIYELFVHATWFRVSMLTLNLLVVGYMGYRLWASRAERASTAARRNQRQRRERR